MLLRILSIIVLIFGVFTLLISCSVPTTDLEDIERIAAQLVLEYDRPDVIQIVAFLDEDRGDEYIRDDVSIRPLQQPVRVWGFRDGVAQQLDNSEWEHEVARGERCPDKSISLHYIRVRSWSSTKARMEVSYVHTFGSCVDGVCYPDISCSALKIERIGSEWSQTKPDEDDYCPYTASIFSQICDVNDD